MKPLDLKIEWLRSKGFGAEQRGEHLYICAQAADGHWFGWILFGNPTYRFLREGIPSHFRCWTSPWSWR